MKKIFVIMPDKPPYSLCASSYAKGFKHSGFFMEKAFSSELDNDYVINFKPDIVMCFNFSELKEGFLEKLHKHFPKCVFIFNFLTKIDKKKDLKNIKLLTDFDAKKLILTSDITNTNYIPNSNYLPLGINFRRYKTNYEGYNSIVTLMSNPDNINVLKTIIDLITSFGEISFYADEFDYLNSLENELWIEYTNDRLKELYKKSYKGEIVSEKQRADIFASSIVNVVPITKTQTGVDFRVFEIAASSGFALCEETEEVKRLFDVGRELETYRKQSELVDKVGFYINNPSIARSIGQNARKAAVNNHSILDRVKKIVKLIEEKDN